MGFKKNYFYLLLSTFSLALAGCGCSEEEKKPTSIEFGFEELSLLEESTKQLDVSILPEAEYKDLTITYSSSDLEVATVSEAGVLQALKEGQTTIKAKLEGYDFEDSFLLHVYEEYHSDYVFDVKEDEYSYHEAELKKFPTFTNDPNKVDEANQVYLYTQELVFELNDDGESYMVMGLDKYSFNRNDVYIPEEYNGKPVTKIKNEAFIYMWYVFNVYIPKTITEIGAAAFSNCGIKNLYYDAEEILDFPGSNWIFFPQTVDFSPSQMTQNIHLLVGPNVKTIPSRLFHPVGVHAEIHPKVASIEFSEGCKLESIGEYAFYGLDNVESVYLPSSLKEVGEYAFYNTGITELKLPEGLTTIKDNAFMLCDSLAHVKTNSSLEYIGESAFYGCEALKYLSFKDTKVKNLSNYAFKNCLSLEYLDLGGVEEVGDSAFENCSHLPDIYLNENVSFVGYKAFQNCSGTENLYIGNNVSEIGNNAFYGLVNLKNLYVATNEIEELEVNNNIFALLGKDNSEGIDVILSNEVSKLAKRMFLPNGDASESIHIKRLFIPTSFEHIYEYALYGANVDSLRFFGKSSEYSVVIEDYNGELPSPVFMGDMK